MLTMADKLMWFKYVVKNVAYRNGKTATFMPMKPASAEQIAPTTKDAAMSRVSL